MAELARLPRSIGRRKNVWRAKSMREPQEIADVTSTDEIRTYVPSV
jgi:hypothetical protein